MILKRMYPTDYVDQTEGRLATAVPMEWELIKDSIDMARDGCYTADEVAILHDFRLWDTDNDRLDEEAVRKLYMENS